jgi:uncharacterized protein
LPALAALFALVALIYASVGFGGGSTYTALLAWSGTDYRLIPVIALICNIIVVVGGSFRFAKAGHVDWRAILPLIIVSAPMAYIGGQIELKEATFFLLLGMGLLVSSLALFVPVDGLPMRSIPKLALLGISGVVGLLAGLSGIGGGILLAPLLHLVRWAEARRIAAFASLYILANSIAGLAGQFGKTGSQSVAALFLEYWPLMLAVLAGGQLGSSLGVRILPQKYIRWLTALLVGYVAIRLLVQN